MKLQGINIRGIAASVPKEKEDNLSLRILSDDEREKFVETTGIRFRPVSKSLSSSELCTDAANRLLSDLKWQEHDIDILVYVTQTPDLQIPGTASQIHDKLKFRKNCLAIDINQGCAGYVYGLSIIGGMMQSLGLKKGLLLVGDTITKHISENNQVLRPVFSDAGSATAIEFSDDNSEINFEFEVDGSKFKTIHLPNSTDANLDLQMNGHEVFLFGLRDVSAGIQRLIQQFGGTENVDYLIMHQANKLLNDSIAKKLGLAPEKVPSSHYQYGNTSSASIPVTILSALKTETFRKPKKMILAGFGVGLTWGAAYLKLESVSCLPIHEL